MNVLILHSELGVLRGGGENFTRNLFTAFAERGHHVTAAFVADSIGGYSLSLPPSIEPVPICGWWSRNLGQGTLSYIGRYVPSESRLRQKWDRVQQAISWRTIRWYNQCFQKRIESEFAPRWQNFDAVYVHGDSILASVAARHCPTVLRLPGPVTAELAPILHAIHAVCANGDALAQIRHFLSDQAIELPVGLDIQLFKPGESSIRASLGWTEQHRVVGYVGRLTHLKGVDLLSAAFRQVSQNAAVNARLLIVGNGEEERAARAILAKEIAHGLVHIEPGVNHDQLPEWYRAMDILAMPSRYENFSNAILEAMACGIPFLASNVGGNKIIGKSGAGWLFESESISSLVGSLNCCLNGCPELQGRGKIGADYVRSRHSWVASAERLERIFVSRLGVTM
jgi:glycosyltransferase involved in cell wall biosynthesis